MLGSDLVEALNVYEVCGVGRSRNRHPSISYEQVHISSDGALLNAFRKLKPAITVHAAAYTDVDGCELNPEEAFRVNVEGTRNVVRACEATGSALFFVSSDYVFNGRKAGSYNEQDVPSPISVYGRTKLEAEEIVRTFSGSSWIIRSTWLFGENGKNFFKAILSRLKRNEILKVVNDQFGAPTYTKDLASGMKVLIERGNRSKRCQVYHLANSGSTHWFDAAKKLLQHTGVSVEITPISSQTLNRPAKRPHNSVFDLTKIKSDFGIELRSWESALEEYWTRSLKREFGASP